MSFNVNLDAVQERELVPEGEFDCVITQAVEKKTAEGKKFIQISFASVDGRFPGYANDFLWKVRDSSLANVEGYPEWRLATLIRATKLERTNFESLDDFLRSLMNRYVRITVEHDHYNGRTYDRVKHIAISNRARLISKADFDIPF